MYYLLKHPKHRFATVISPDNIHYPDYIRAGYEKVNEGTYKAMEEIQKQVVEEFLNTLPNETN